MMEFTYNGIVRQGFGFYNPNHAAALICALIPFVLAGFFRWKHWAARTGFAALFVLLSIALALTFSRTGALVLGFELLCFAAFSGRKHWKPLLAAAAIVLLVLLSAGALARFTPDRAVGNRFEIWRAGAALFAANPWRGVGLGNSGALVTGFLLRDGIDCRTLVNSHLTLLAEEGIFVALPCFALVFYALLRGGRKTAAWTAFAGLTLSAFSSSVFDWDLLFDFSGFGGLPLSNFLLSWGLFLFYAGLAGFLCVGTVKRDRFAAAAGLALFCLALPFTVPNRDAPEVSHGLAFRRGRAMPLALYDDAWTLREVRPFLKNGGCTPLHSWQKHADVPAVETGKVVLFGECAAFADRYPEAGLVFVSPPPFFPFPPNTRMVYLRRFAAVRRPGTVPVRYY